MEFSDDDLHKFEAEGAAPLPITEDQGSVENEGAQIWYGAYGSGSPVILLHGGLGHSGNWGYQVPALLASGYRAIVIDSRGHGFGSREFGRDRLAHRRRIRARQGRSCDDCRWLYGDCGIHAMPLCIETNFQSLRGR